MTKQQKTEEYYELAWFRIPRPGDMIARNPEDASEGSGMGPPAPLGRPVRVDPSVFLTKDWPLIPSMMLVSMRH